MLKLPKRAALWLAELVVDVVAGAYRVRVGLMELAGFAGLLVAVATLASPFWALAVASVGLLLKSAEVERAAQRQARRR